MMECSGVHLKLYYLATYKTCLLTDHYYVVNNDTSTTL